MGATVDNQLVRELLSNLIASAEILGIENQWSGRAKEILPRLAPHQISQEGYLQEWLEDYREVEPHHRHVSHLYGLYPGNQISTHQTPELAAAARKTLNRRGDEATGWSRAWKINFWARLKEGERASQTAQEPTLTCKRRWWHLSQPILCASTFSDRWQLWRYRCYL